MGTHYHNNDKNHERHLSIASFHSQKYVNTQKKSTVTHHKGVSSHKNKKDPTQKSCIQRTTLKHNYL